MNSDSVIVDLGGLLPRVGEYDFVLEVRDSRAVLRFEPYYDCDLQLPIFAFSSVVFSMITTVPGPAVIRFSGSKLSLNALVRLGRSKIADDWCQYMKCEDGGYGHFQAILPEKDSMINIVAESVAVQ